LRKDGKVRIHLKNPAENNKANLELVKELSKALGGCNVRLLSGQTSKRKKLEIDASKEEFERLF